MHNAPSPEQAQLAFDGLLILFALYCAASIARDIPSTMAQIRKFRERRARK